MSGSIGKPLGRDVKLPPLPPDSLISPPPPPPPKNVGGLVLDIRPDDGPQLPPIPSLASLGFDLPKSPGPAASSMSLAFPTSPTEKTKKSSPLTDLIESEKIYVEYLTGIIRRVAAAWSRSNLPPPELDVMFRSIESVYKTNRTLLAKLKEIGANPSSPKALGDLLMRWIDDLDRPYTTYCQKFSTGFDQWEPVKSNVKLPGVLEAFSTASPPSIAAIQSSQLADPSLWTLDALFLLPKGRLLYYRKLYNRLLKSTVPGRSDHRLLTGALEKLDDLLETLDGRCQVKVGHSPPASSSALPPVTSDVKPEPVAVASPAMSPVTEFDATQDQLLSGQFGGGNASATTSVRGSGSSSGERFSRETGMTSINHHSTPAMPTSIANLEKRLATDMTLDIFTMEPKLVRLQMSPPTLPYARELKLSANVVVHFTPRSTGVNVVHQHGFVFILSDLFLICEKMSLDDRVAAGVDGPDMRLCYPPLSGKVLKVTEVPDQDNVLQISIMRKETLILEAISTQSRDEIIKEFKECIAFARTMSGTASEPVPPLPKGFPVSPVANFPPANEGLPSREQAHDTQQGVLQEQVTSSSALNGKPELPELPSAPNFSRPRITSQQSFAPRKTSLGQFAPGPVMGGNGNGSPSEGAGMPQTQNFQGAQRTPSLHDAPSGVSHPMRKPSAGQGASTHPPPSSFGMGQIMPPARSTSMTNSSHPFPDQDPNMRGAPHRVYSPPAVQGYPQQPPLHHQSSINSPHHTSMQSLHHQPSLNHQHPSNHQHLRPPQSAPPQSQSMNFSQHPHHTQPFPSRSTGPGGPPHGLPPPRPPSEPQPSSGRLHKSASSRSLHSQYDYAPGPGHAPPLPSLPGGLPIPSRPYDQRTDSISSAGSGNNASMRPILPSQQIGSRANSFTESNFQDHSPPTSPIEERKPLGPAKPTITEMKCRVFHQQQHAQWKSLGSAQLTLYHQQPTNVKQLVVGAGSKDKKNMLISTIVLTDGVERVGKTGVAIELSDAKGARTGIIYMIQLRNEQAAQELFDKLLAGSDRSK